MGFNKIGIIIGHEYSTRVRKKSFLVTTFLTPLLFGLCFAIPLLTAFLGSDETFNVKVIDQSGIVAPFLQGDEHLTYTFGDVGEDIDAVRSSLSEKGLYALVVVSPLDSANMLSVDTYSNEPLNIDVKQDLKHNVNKAVEDYRLGLYNISNLDSILADVKSDITINSMTMTEDGRAKEDTVEIYMILAYLMSFLIYIFVFMFGNSVMTSVIEEKSSRVVEVVVSSVRSVELMIGKIVGVAMVALTQFLIWVVVTLLIVTGLSSAVSGRILKSHQAEIASVTAAATEQAGVSANISDLADVIEMSSAEGENDGVVKVLRQVSDMNWFLIIGSFLIYFILGYLLYASMFAAVGAAVDNASEAGQLQMPITIPLMIGLFIMISTFQHPSSTLSVWASIIPWTSPMVMLARIPFGTVPSWQLILSILLLAVTFVATSFLSARIYKVGILTFGKKNTFKDLFKWMKSDK